MFKVMFLWLAFVSLYIILAMFSFQTRDPWSLSTLVWVPSGLVLGTLFVTSPRYWHLWLVSAALVHAIIGFVSGRPLPVALLFALCDVIVLSACACALRLQYRKAEGLPAQNNVLTMLKYGLTIIGFGCAGGMLSSWCLFILGYPILLLHAVTWALSTSVSGLAFFTLFYCYRRRRVGSLTTGSGHALFQDLVFIALNLVVLVVVFTRPGERFSDHFAGYNPVIIPFMVLELSAFFCATRSTAALLLLQYLWIVYATVRGMGAFANVGNAFFADVLNAQWYLLASTALALWINAQTEAIKRVSDHLEHNNALLDHLSAQAPVIRFTISLPDQHIEWLTQGNAAHLAGFRDISSVPLFTARCSEETGERINAYLNSDDRQPLRDVFPLYLGSGIQTCTLAMQHCEERPLINGLLLLSSEEKHLEPERRDQSIKP
jgi:hypothetical protein